MEFDEYLDISKEIKNLISKREEYRNEIKDWVISQFKKLYESVEKFPKGYFEKKLSTGFVWCEPDGDAFSKLENGGEYLLSVVRFGDIYDNVAIPRDKILFELSIDEMKQYSKWYILNYGD